MNDFETELILKSLYPVLLSVLILIFAIIISEINRWRLYKKYRDGK